MSREDATFYKDPANVKAGRHVASPRPPLSGHVPVRFPDEVIASVKTIAAHDGVSVSTWIRNLVNRELERRSAPTTEPTPVNSLSYIYSDDDSQFWTSADDKVKVG
jgi:hypothetical protein